MDPETTTFDVSVVIATLNERENLERLLPELWQVLGGLGLRAEILILDGPSTDGTAEAALRLGARVIRVPRGGYGEAIRVGLRQAGGRYIITMDADLSHGPEVIAALWQARDPSTIGIASRYVAGGTAKMSISRTILSRLLNLFFARGLSLPVRDLSSGFRIYPAPIAKQLHCVASNFDILPELLVRAHSAGWRIKEVPFHYAPRLSGSSKARVARLGVAYISTFGRLWKLRNSIESADYDERAYDSIVPLQRGWQRRRHDIVTRNVALGGRTLDVGCGSSRILGDIGNAVGVDVVFRKLRYMSRYRTPLVQASVFALPFLDASFETIVCSEVIEHIPASGQPFHEMARVNKPGGRLVLGTPDYGTRSWRMIEAAYRLLAPGGYADEHITHYTHDQLRDMVVGLGYRHLRTEYVFGSEMILAFAKNGA